MKTLWIVDASYVYFGQQQYGQIDYVKLKSFLEDAVGETFSEAHYMNSVPDPATEGQNKFHTWLKLAPPRGPKFIVTLYDLKILRCVCPACNHEFERRVQKGVDVGIATLAIKLAFRNKYDRLVLTAGDGDFEDAIKYITSDLDKELVLSGFSGSISPDLQSYAQRVILLDENWDAVRK